jgi:hypothetical protein
MAIEISVTPEQIRELKKARRRVFPVATNVWAFSYPGSGTVIAASDEAGAWADAWRHYERTRAK